MPAGGANSRSPGEHAHVPRLFAACLSLLGPVWAAETASAQPAAPPWVTAWAASAQGPYPTGNPSAQPDLHFALPSAEAGARDQTLRLMLRPAIWGEQARLRLSNVLGTRPVTFDGVFAALQQSGSVIEPGTSAAVAFAGSPSVTVPPGQSVWSDPVRLPFVQATPDPALTGNRLAISFTSPARAAR